MGHMEHNRHRSLVYSYMANATPDKPPLVQGKTNPKLTVREELEGQFARWQESLLGQPDALRQIWPYVRQFKAGLNPVNRPAGAFMLLGPTGVGKTRTVESLADVLHGAARYMIRIDCGEFQMEHEVAKLIGAPPGYLGHRETQPMLTQRRLMEAAASCPLTLVLFDEIEKAAPSLMQLLLGVLDHGKLKLGSNEVVSFERTMIFFTSNLGARELHELERGKWTLVKDGDGAEAKGTAGNRVLRSRARAAYEKHFSPEFRNRIDEVIVYGQIAEEHKRGILRLVLEEHFRGMGISTPSVWVEEGAVRELLRLGTAHATGARALKRVVQRKIMQPLADCVIELDLSPQLVGRSAVNVSLDGDTFRVQVFEDGVGAVEAAEGWREWLSIGWPRAAMAGK